MKYHRTYICENDQNCEKAQILLELNNDVLSITNIGTLTLKRNYRICSKQMNVKVCDDDDIFAPGDTIIVKEPVDLSKLQLISAYMEVNCDNAVKSNSIKVGEINKIIDPGIESSDDEPVQNGLFLPTFISFSASITAFDFSIGFSNFTTQVLSNIDFQIRFPANNPFRIPNTQVTFNTPNGVVFSRTASIISGRIITVAAGAQIIIRVVLTNPMLKAGVNITSIQLLRSGVYVDLRLSSNNHNIIDQELSRTTEPYTFQRQL